VGHSEGGIIASLVAAKPQSDVAFIISLAGTGVPGDRVYLEQQLAISRADGASESELKSNRELFERILPIAKTSRESRDDLTNRLVTVAKERQSKMPDKKLSEEMDRLASPWMRFFLTHDPAATLAQVKCPVLALNGEKDLQVLPDTNLTSLDSVLKQSGNPKSKAVRLVGLNHLFQTARTGSPKEYETIEETISPDVLRLMSDWINSVL
jgi:uncharacterized protein